MVLVTSLWGMGAAAHTNHLVGNIRAREVIYSPKSNPGRTLTASSIWEETATIKQLINALLQKEPSVLRICM